MIRPVSPEMPLQFTVYEDALVVPSPSRTVYRGIDGGAFDSKLRPIDESMLTRNWESGQISYPPDIAALRLDDLESVDEMHVYGGYFFDHFGHFLLESLARAWVVEDIGTLPFVWASGDPPNTWQAEILSLLGLDVPHRFPRRPTLFRRLVVPDPGFRIQGEFHPRHAEFLRRFEATEPSAGRHRRVWLSRSRVNSSTAPSRGEVELQRALARRGWHVLHPGSVSVTEQLEAMASADVVAGLEGSAFHAALLLKVTRGSFLVLRRTTNRNYRAIADRNGIVEFDLYGSFRVHDRRDVSLVRPGRSAEMLEQLSQLIEGCSGDREQLEVLRGEFEGRHGFERWRRRQRWRLAAHGKIALRKSSRRYYRRFRSTIGRIRRRLLG